VAAWLDTDAREYYDAACSFMALCSGRQASQSLCPHLYILLAITTLIALFRHVACIRFSGDQWRTRSSRAVALSAEARQFCFDRHQHASDDPAMGSRGLRFQYEVAHIRSACSGCAEPTLVSLLSPMLWSWSFVPKAMRKLRQRWRKSRLEARRSPPTAATMPVVLLCRSNEIVSLGWSAKDY
jgi:hypothetical protein